MKAWQVSDARWANGGDLALPLWERWNRRSPLPGESWAYPYLASRVPRHAESRVAGSLDPAVLAAHWPRADHGCASPRYALGLLDTLEPAAVRDLIEAARHRVVVAGAPGDLAGLEELLGAPVPPPPADAVGRTLGITVDARDEPRTVGILIPHWESWQFLRPAVEAITRFADPALDQRVYVLDDSSRDGSFEKAEAEYADRDDVRVLRIERPNKDREADVGLLLDIGLREVEEQYVAMIDADLFPLARDWLGFPIWLIEELGLSAVGLDTGLSTAYLRSHPKRAYAQPADGYWPSAQVYENDFFTIINNLYRVMPTALAKVVSESIGFSRSSTRWERLHERVRQRLSALLPTDRLDRRYPYMRGNVDNGVAANHFIDVNRLGPKFNIPLTSYIGLTPRDGAFGQNIAGLAFHFALSTRALSSERREVDDAGAEYNRWVERLAAAGGFREELLEEMVRDSEVMRPGGYDGSIPESWYREQLERITELRRRYERERASA